YGAPFDLSNRSDKTPGCTTQPSTFFVPSVQHTAYLICSGCLTINELMMCGTPVVYHMAHATTNDRSIRRHKISYNTAGSFSKPPRHPRQTWQQEICRTWKTDKGCQHTKPFLTLDARGQPAKT
ncbi:unnamed protein product, partial [Ectocarpus sp. 12 AP-2014]